MKTALILPGGGTRGAIEVGVMEVLFKYFIPDVIIGTSVGAINAAGLSLDKNPLVSLEKLKEFWRNLKQKNIFVRNPFFPFFSSSIFSNKGLYKIVDNAPTHFSNLLFPAFINCTHLKSGKSILFSEGAIADVLVASCSPPGILPPVKINGELYVDGALSSVLGIENARKLGIDKFVVVNVEYIDNISENIKSFVDALNHSWVLARNQNIRHELEIFSDKNVLEVKVSNDMIDAFPIKKNPVLMERFFELGRNAARKTLEKESAFLRNLKGNK